MVKRREMLTPFIKVQVEQFKADNPIDDIFSDVVNNIIINKLMPSCTSFVQFFSAQIIKVIDC
jgi:hypothetical protein